MRAAYVEHILNVMMNLAGMAMFSLFSLENKTFPHCTLLRFVVDVILSFYFTMRLSLAGRLDAM